MDNKENELWEESGMLPLELEFTPDREPEESPIPEEIPVFEEIPVEEAPAVETPVEETPVEEIPVEEISVQEPDFSFPREDSTLFPADKAVPAEESVFDPGPESPREEPACLSFLPREEDFSLEEELKDIPDLLPEQPRRKEDTADQEYRDNGRDFDEMMNAPAPEKKIPTHKRPARKGRPKKRGGEGLWGIPNILATLVWLALIVVIGVTAGRMIWVCAADVLAFGREDKPVTVTVYETDTIEDITDKLYDAGLIRYKSLFHLYATLSHADEDIGPGIHDLNTRYDYHALVNFMTPSSNRTIIKVMIPEGYTCAQIFELLEENKVITAQDLASYAATGELDEYWFLENVERGDPNALEGFLFPDTYEFYKNDSPRNILQKMLNNFDNRFDEEMRLQIDSLNNYLADLMRQDGKDEDYIANHRFTVREVAIVASLIEKETAHSGESPVIASVIYNRLFNWGGNPAYLNIDASIIYALGGKTKLTREDLQVDSPYNTYRYTGLTPTPIANPGLNSLKAALNPESTNYYFYVLNPAQGSHQFSTTREEHESWVSQFAGTEG